ncbi:hypothetical protein NPIL_581581 [Nephila pilipes]|uniref:Uncharacterized protein n=1 Tax=Nephila pilipes TaxID=299642 RepID=A0A8X6N5B9_NEPPI|nr:hypothetical protein NPIL_581581 [Nephila pilipes]
MEISDDSIQAISIDHSKVKTLLLGTADNLDDEIRCVNSSEDKCPPVSMEVSNDDDVEHSEAKHIITDLISHMFEYYNKKLHRQMKIPSRDVCLECDWGKDGMCNYLRYMCTSFRKYFIITFRVTHPTKNVEEQTLVNYGKELINQIIKYQPDMKTDLDIFSKFIFACAALCEYNLYRDLIGHPDRENVSVGCLVSLFENIFASHFSDLKGWKELEKFCLQLGDATSTSQDTIPKELKNVRHLFKDDIEVNDLLFALGKFKYMQDDEIDSKYDNGKYLYDLKYKIRSFVKKLFIVIKGRFDGKSIEPLSYLDPIGEAVIQISEYYKKPFRSIIENYFPHIPEKRYEIEYVFFKQCAFLYLSNICSNQSFFEMIAMTAFTHELENHIANKPGKKCYFVQEILADVLFLRYREKFTHFGVFLLKLASVCEGMTNGIHFFVDKSLSYASSPMTQHRESLQLRLEKIIIEVKKGTFVPIDATIMDESKARKLLPTCFAESLVAFSLIISKYKSNFKLPAYWKEPTYISRQTISNRAVFEFAESLTGGVQQFCWCLRKQFRMIFEYECHHLLTSEDELCLYLVNRSLILSDNATKFTYHTIYAFMSEALIYFMQKNEKSFIKSTDALIKLASRSFTCILQQRFDECTCDSWKEVLKSYSIGTCSAIHAINYANSSCDTDISVKERSEVQALKINVAKIIPPMCTLPEL